MIVSQSPARRVVRRLLLPALIACAVVPVTAWTIARLMQPSRELAAPAAPGPDAADATASAREAYGNLPASFEENTGQAAPSVKFVARGSGYALFLTSREAVLSLRPNADDASAQTASALPAAPTGVRMTLVGANEAPVVRGTREQSGASHYLIGGDPGQWRTSVRHFGAVEYDEIYPGVDLVFYGNQRQLEYDFVVAPQADPGRIALEFTGVDGARLDDGGDLLLTVGSEEIRQYKPVIYQEVDGVRQMVAGGYRLDGQQVRFEVAEYDPRLPLVIDPVLVYSTHIGGSVHDRGIDIAIDDKGAAYIVGLVMSVDFPTTPSSFQPSHHLGGGFLDAFVTKLNPQGTALVYSTYLGGAGDDSGLAIAVDRFGQAFVTGVTPAPDFPTTPGAYRRVAPAGSNVFVTKLNRNGSGLVYSTFLGGAADEQPRGIAVDENGRAHVTGWTQSADFPTTRGALQRRLDGTQDAFVTALDWDGRSLEYSTYLGGGDVDNGNAIDVDAFGYAYVVGQTSSVDFPTTRRALRRHFGGVSDAFVTKLGRHGKSLVYSTYLGGSSNYAESGTGIAVAHGGEAYVTGWTRSSDFPITPGAFQPLLAGVQDAFVTQLTDDGKDVVYSTFLGGAADESGLGVALDRRGYAYVAGVTMSADFPTRNAFQPGNAGGGGDAFIAKLSRRGTWLLAATFLGGAGGDSANALATDERGNVFVTGTTTSSRMLPPAFPVTAGAFQPVCNGCPRYEEGFVAKVDMDAWP